MCFLERRGSFNRSLVLLMKKLRLWDIKWLSTSGKIGGITSYNPAPCKPHCLPGDPGHSSTKPILTNAVASLLSQMLLNFYHKTEFWNKQRHLLVIYLWFLDNFLIYETVKCVPLWESIKMEKRDHQPKLKIHDEYRFGGGGHSEFLSSIEGIMKCLEE